MEKGSAQAKLVDILKGNLEDISKPAPVIINGTKIRNKILKKLVEVQRKKGVKDADIINKLISYDDLAERGKLSESMFQ